MSHLPARSLRILLSALVAGSAAATGCSLYDDSLLGVSSAGQAGGGRDNGGAGAAQADGGASAGQAKGGTAGNGGGGASGRAGAFAIAGQSEGGAAGQGDGGAPDQSDAGAANTGGAAVSLGLRHRYSFSGSGVKVVDSMGTASGTVVNTQLNGSGKLTLAAATLAQYVDLPNGIISQLGDATVEVWFTVSAAGGVWERVFDFGSSDAGEGNQGLGATYLFFSPKSNNSQIHGIIHTSSTNGELLVSDALTAVDKTVVVALVVDDSHDTLTLYKDGTFRSAVAFLGHLSEIQDVNNWLGRSQFKDPVFRGTIDELRIYGSALSASAIAKSFGAGPDATINP